MCTTSRTHTLQPPRQHFFTAACKTREEAAAFCDMCTQLRVCRPIDVGQAFPFLQTNELNYQNGISVPPIQNASPLALTPPPTAACDQSSSSCSRGRPCVLHLPPPPLQLLLLRPRAAASHMQFWFPSVDAIMCERVVLKMCCSLCTVLWRFQVAGFNLI